MSGKRIEKGLPKKESEARVRGGKKGEERRKSLALIEAKLMLLSLCIFFVVKGMATLVAIRKAPPESLVIFLAAAPVLCKE